MACPETLPFSSEASDCESNSPLQPKKGMSIFRDILRRADKNDDGKLSFDEFKAYFVDGVLNSEEMHELFRTIDSNNTDNLNIEEICEYFSQHLGEYENVLAALEELNVSILKAMDKTKKDYQGSCNLEQFVTRFLLKETVNQLQSLQNSLECAMETTEEQTRQERRGPVKPEVLSINWSGKRSSRRLQRTNSLSPNNTNFSIWNSAIHAEEDFQWMTQINRLQKLIDRLEKKDLKLEPLEEEILEGNTKSHILIVQRQMSVLGDKLEEFRLALRQYVVSATAQTGCLLISVQKISAESCFTLYEFWENTNLWKNHIQTNYNKTFQRSNVDFLDAPELITTMLVPGKHTIWLLHRPSYLCGHFEGAIDLNPKILLYVNAVQVPGLTVQ
ncbi:N-terminal EF-hand calcium-binding protein 1 isoform X1 [Stegostoma tigrinum]|uniref:N-terminal EF-hand calcium-binding protein 1 isoform X1 n=1 Tax=Stegostoma tigrinum TaxID=3053191 RepID=UPI0028706CF5|nr:N-terminal EF-hand calcium-binding protein 1 isoform X1 [Stegostoma tigrinum]